MDSNNQQLNKKMGGTYRIRNLKSSSQFYEVIMPQHYYENQIKDKLMHDLKGKLNMVAQFHQARKQASLLAEAEKNKGSYED